MLLEAGLQHLPHPSRAEMGLGSEIHNPGVQFGEKGSRAQKCASGRLFLAPPCPPPAQTFPEEGALLLLLLPTPPGLFQTKGT